MTAAAYLRVCDDDDAVDGGNVPQPPLVDLVRRCLADAPEPLSRAALRRRLRVNNQRLGDALLRLERDRIARRSSQGWTLERPERCDQLSLPGS